jgi:hypothetical protein
MPVAHNAQSPNVTPSEARRVDVEESPREAQRECIQVSILDAVLAAVACAAVRFARGLFALLRAV